MYQILCTTGCVNLSWPIPISDCEAREARPPSYIGSGSAVLTEKGGDTTGIVYFAVFGAQRATHTCGKLAICELCVCDGMAPLVHSLARNSIARLQQKQAAPFVDV